MPMCLKRTGAEKQKVTSRKQDVPTHDWGSQAAKQHCRRKQIFPAIVKVDGAKHKLCLMTSLLRASAKNCAGRGTALKKHQESITAGMGVVRTSSRKGVGRGDTCRKSLSGETIFSLPHRMFELPSQTHSQKTLVQGNGLDLAGSKLVSPLLNLLSQLWESSGAKELLVNSGIALSPALQFASAHKEHLHLMIHQWKNSQIKKCPQYHPWL